MAQAQPAQVRLAVGQYVAKVALHRRGQPRQLGFVAGLGALAAVANSRCTSPRRRRAATARPMIMLRIGVVRAAANSQAIFASRYIG